MRTTKKRYFARTLNKVFAVSPQFFVMEYSFTLFDATMLVITTYAFQRFVDSIGRWNDNAGTKFTTVIAALLVFAIYKIIDEAIDGIANFLGEYYSNKCNQKFIDELNASVQKASALEYEDAKFLNDVTKAYEGASSVRKQVHVVFDIICLYLPYFAFMMYYLFRLDHMLSVLLPLVFIPVLLSHIVRAKIFSDSENDSIGHIRKLEHYRDCMISRNYIKDTRYLGLQSFFYDRFIEEMLSIRMISNKAEKRAILSEMIAGTISIIGYGMVFALIIYTYANGRINIGGFSAAIYGTLEMFSMMNEIFDFRLGELSSSIGKIRNYYAFIDRKNENEKPRIWLEDNTEVALDDVSFKYPNRDENSVTHIMLKIEKGKSIAIVGENGSGKTTLAKIIMGLYRPSEGTIYYNGNKHSDIDEASVQRAFSAVFQDFRNYSLSLRENVSISDFNKYNNTADEIIMVEESLEKSGFNTKRQELRDGLETMLTREFAGIELSRGEWQRIAIARAFFRSAGIIIFDEPTASIDPFEEDAIYKEFLALRKNKTSIIITHRLAAAKIVDKVIVMRGGEIIAEGKHEDLLENSRYYRKLWELQRGFLAELGERGKEM